MKKDRLGEAVLLFGRVGMRVIGQTCQIVHAGFQCNRNTAALFKCHISLSCFDFGIITLINAGQHLHFDLDLVPDCKC